MDAIKIRYWLFVTPALLAFLIGGILFLILRIAHTTIQLAQIATLEIIMFFYWLATGNEPKIEIAKGKRGKQL